MKSVFTILLFATTFLFSYANTIVLSENFDTCPTSWDYISLSGNNVWSCSSFSGRTYVGFEDFNGGDDDWLISPSVNLDLYAQEYLSFEYLNRREFDGLTLYYSTDYDGTGTSTSVSSATWTNMPLDLFDINGNGFVSNYLYQRSLDLSGISGSAVYFAFRFESSPTEDRIWQLDNFLITADYYTNIESGISNDGDKCYSLKLELAQLINDHTRIEYTSSDLDVWDAFLTTDRRLNDAGTDIIVYDMYSDNPTGAEPYEYKFGNSTFGGNQQSSITQTAEGQFFNREHVFPKSWWGGGTNAIDTSYTDLHLVVPSDSEVNSIKSNYPMGESNSPSTITQNGCRQGANSTTGYTGQIFEPIDEYKGDFARILLYVSTRYTHEAADWESNYTNAMDGNPYTFFDVWLRTLLLQWHENDPVSQKEIDRNNAVFSIQGNRNPFIDHPEYVSYIWGTSTDIGCPTFLPVELLSFEGDADADQISSLNWVTVAESNSSYFEIQHSLDGINFDKIGEVDAAGNSSEETSYSFLHKDAAMGTNYYRLKIIDLDGSFEYSDIIKVRHNLKGLFSIYPTVTNGQLTFENISSIQGEIYLSIFNIQGQQVKQIDLDENIQTQQVDISELGKGTYIIRMETGNLVETKRIFVQ